MNCYLIGTDVSHSNRKKKRKDFLDVHVNSSYFLIPIHWIGFLNYSLTTIAIGSIILPFVEIVHSF